MSIICVYTRHEYVISPLLFVSSFIAMYIYITSSSINITYDNKYVAIARKKRMLIDHRVKNLIALIELFFPTTHFLET